VVVTVRLPVQRGEYADAPNGKTDRKAPPDPVPLPEAIAELTRRLGKPTGEALSLITVFQHPTPPRPGLVHRAGRPRPQAGLSSAMGFWTSDSGP
jgi:hypothetical protein